MEQNQLEKLFFEGKLPEKLGVHAGGVPSCPRGWGARPLPRGSLVPFLTCTPSFFGSFPSKNNFSSWFHSVSTPFDIPFLRNTEIGKKTSILGWASG